MRLILGSQSPRRAEILNYFNLPFEQISSNYDENLLPYLGNPAAYAATLAKEKGKNLSLTYPEAAILTADTVVSLESKIYGKPLDTEDAFLTLKELEGKWHSVHTGVALFFNGKYFEGVEETKVLFNPLTDEHIRKYLKALHWADKAGGYAIQLAGSLIVRRIDGCYYNVMGLPIHTVSKLLNHIGIDLWDHLQ